jgi:hypothetical protein
MYMSDRQRRTGCEEMTAEREHLHERCSDNDQDRGDRRQASLSVSFD